jgi:hypothetical protein
MTTTNISHQFTREELETFAKADAMFGMSLPYMREPAPSKRQKSGLLRKILTSATTFLF